VQPLATETAPRSVCAHCGKPLPPPNGSATFVYGVGAVGYQSCASCGAKWRYLWQDAPAVRVRPDRGRRLVVVLGGVALVAFLVVGAVALARSQRWSGDDENTPTGSSTPVTSPPSSGPPGDPGVAFVYNGIAQPMATERHAYVEWLVESATATPQFQVNERTDEYVERARAEIRSLENGEWPEEIVGEIDSLVETARRFVDDLEPVYSGQAGSPSYITMITEESRAVDTADEAVRRVLGIAPAPE
jgi:hypothetical protein